MAKFWAFATIIVIGIIIADALARPAGVTAFANGFGKLWGTTTAGLQGAAAPKPGKAGP